MSSNAMDRGSLKKYLAAQREGYFDSSGSFTIAAEKALAKLAQSQLPHPSYWVLKFAQFVATVGSKSLNITMERTVWSFALTLPAPLDPQTVQEALGSINPHKDPAIDHLCTAVRALGSIKERRFVLRLSDKKHSNLLLWDGSELSMTRKAEQFHQPNLVLEVTASDPEGWTDKVDIVSVERRARESLLLAQRAFTAPFAVRLDRRFLRFRYRLDARRFTQPLIWDCRPDINGMQLPFLYTLEGEKLDPACWNGEPMPPKAKAFWTLSYNYHLAQFPFQTAPTPEPIPCFHYLHWVSDGIIVETRRSRRKTEGFSLELFLDVRGCPADLGGLRLRKSPQLEEIEELCRGILAGLRPKVAKMLNSAKRLEGKILGGWQSLLTKAIAFPLGSGIHESPEGISKNLAALPEVRRILLEMIQGAPIPEFEKLEFSELS